MKKKFTMNLDQEKVELLQTYLKRSGISWSAYINAFVNTTADAMAGFGIPDDPSTMTLGEAAAMFGEIAKGPDKVKIKKGFDDLKKKKR